jgi:hypothetical protein
MVVTAEVKIMEKVLAVNQTNLCFEPLESMVIELEVITVVGRPKAHSSYLIPNSSLTREQNTNSKVALVAQKMVILAFAVQALL